MLQPLVVTGAAGFVAMHSFQPTSLRVRFVRIGTMQLAHVVDCLFFIQALRISFIPEGSTGMYSICLLMISHHLGLQLKQSQWGHVAQLFHFAFWMNLYALQMTSSVAQVVDWKYEFVCHV